MGLLSSLPNCAFSLDVGIVNFIPQKLSVSVCVLNCWEAGVSAIPMNGSLHITKTSENTVPLYSRL